MASSMERAQEGVRFLKTLIRSSDTDTAGDRIATSFDATALSALHDISCAPGTCRCVLRVSADLQNRFGTLHGGAIATLVDTVGTAALVTLSDRSGVSLNINVNYLSPMPGDEELVIDARVVKVGKVIATIEVDLHRAKTGSLVARGTHVKFLSHHEQPMSEAQLNSEDLKLSQDAARRAAEKSTTYLARSPTRIRSRM